MDPEDNNQPGNAGDPQNPNPDNAAGTPLNAMEGSDNNPQGNPQSAEATLAELERTRTALKRANEEAKNNRLELKKLQDAQTAKERAEMEEADRLQAELDDLKGAAEARDALQSQVEAYETAVNAQVTAMEKALKIPAYIQKLLEAMTPAEKLTYLVENQKHFQPPTKPPLDAQGGGGAPPKPQELDEDRKKALRRRFRLG